jgi:hypothetical protein
LTAPPGSSVNVAVPVTVEPLRGSIFALACAGASDARGDAQASRSPQAAAAMPIRFVCILCSSFKARMIEDMGCPRENDDTTV